MKKYLLPNDVNWYRANFHCHTVCSDGAYTPEKVKEIYKNHGYSIVAYSDHEILLDHSDLNDDEFLALTSSEYSITESNPHFPQVLGVSAENWPRSKCVHLNIFSKDPHNTFQPATSSEQFWHLKQRYADVFKGDGYVREYTKESINEMIKRCNEAGFLVQLNHPYWSLNEREDYINMEGLWGLEILNYATELETGSEYCPYIYDDMVRNGMFNLVCTMGDDNHNHGDSVRESFGGSTFIGAKELKYDQVFEAMKKGHIYCASGRDNPPQFKSLYVEDNKIFIECTPVENIVINGYGRNDRHKTAPENETITSAVFDLRESDVYFRVSLRDKYGNNAHTHTYFVKDYWEKVT